MKKLIILGAVVLMAAAANAQGSEKAPVKAPPATPATTTPPAPATDAATPKSPQTADEKQVSNSHWMAAKNQLESAKKHLSQVKYDPGNQKENAIRSIDAALQEINVVMKMKENENKKDNKDKEHDHSDPNHKH